MSSKLLIIAGGVVCAVFAWLKLDYRPREWEKFAAVVAIGVITLALADSWGDQDSLMPHFAAYFVYFIGAPAVLISAFVIGGFVADKTSSGTLAVISGIICFVVLGGIMYRVLDMIPDATRIIDRLTEDRDDRW